MGKVRGLYRCADAGLLRASVHGDLAVPDWPHTAVDSPEGAALWTGWLRRVWTQDAVVGAIEHASPVLARQVEELCGAGGADVRRVRRTVLSVARYVQRMTGRSTPAGLFAGVSAAGFGSEASVRWGSVHRAEARADASWLTEVIAKLESCPELVARLPLMTNTAAFVRGDRLVVPYPPRSDADHGPAPAEVSVRRTHAVRVAVEAARSPIRAESLAGKLAAEFPAAPAATIGAMVASLVKQHVLISALHVPSTVTDAFGHVMEELAKADAGGVAQVAGLVGHLHEIQDGLKLHGEATTVSAGRSIRSAVTEKMTALAPAAPRPLAVDLRVDCSLVLPWQVAREAEVAASVLARLSAYPSGTPAWRDFFTRFFERYGVGSPVPVLDVVDPDVGIGFPAGYLGSRPEPSEPLTSRHRRLLALAQAAALDVRREVVLDDRLVADLAGGPPGPGRVPPHLELCFQLDSPSLDALQGGDFRLAVVSASRAAGTMSGRFLDLLEPFDRERAVGVFERLFAADPKELAVQVSFAPLDPRDAHVARAPQVLPAAISVAEHRPPDASSIPLDDVAVVCDKNQLYLVSLSRGQRLSPTVLHALDLRAHTPPLVRFLVEVVRAQQTVVTGFDWGPAAHLPFLPRLRYGRIIVSPARWRLERTELPKADAPWPAWCEALAAWRDRRGLPADVHLAEGDQRLKLDLEEPGHLVLLRAHLDNAEAAVLTEAPDAAAYDWFGGRPHEIVIPMTAAMPPTPVVPPRTVGRRPTGRGHGDLPGSSIWLHAKLYGHLDRQPEIVARYLPELFAVWEEPPRWWFTRFGDPEWHLRLRIALSGAADFGTAARRVSAWTDGLRRQGLLRDLQFATSYPEPGRWGEGPAMDAAEDVFVADSRAVAAQFSAPEGVHPNVLAAVQFVSIACGFTGATETGMRWLIDHTRTDAARPLDRSLLKEVMHLADPGDDWAALKATPAGRAIAGVWHTRGQVLARYRAELTLSPGPDPDLALDSLLHAHHIRAVGVDPDDERTCRRLARAAALSWRARRAQEEE